MDNLGEIIKIARIKKRLSQEELARILNVTKGSISSWENNKYAPDGKILVKLAIELDIVGELFPGYTKNKRIEPVIEKDDEKFKSLEKRVSILETLVKEMRIF